MDGFWVLLGCSAAASAILLIHERVQRRAQLQRFVSAYQDLQQLILSPVEFIEVTDSNAEPLLARIDKERIDEVARHAIELGNVVMRRGEAVVGALRVFVDEPRTTLICLLALESGTVISVESYTADAEFETHIGSPYQWTRPPFIHVQDVSVPLPIARLLVAHHEFVGSARGPLLRFESVPDAIRVWLNFRDREVAWRANQPPDELAERDMRLTFGPTYKPMWTRLRGKLRAPLPKAETRKRPGARN